MKKMCLLGISLFTAFTMMAQESLVKDVEHQLKASKPNYAQALKNIQPALTNPETANQMNTWYTAGKAAFGVFDEAFKKLTTGNELTPAEKKEAGNAYVDGYEYYIKALPLDSLPDAKGKIKPKKSKDILNELKGGHGYLNYAASFLFDAQDFDNAYRALDLFVNAPHNPMLAKNPPLELADTVRGQMYLAEAQALLLSNEAAPDSMKCVKAIEVLDLMPATGYESENRYVFGLIAARAIGNKEAKTRYAKEAYEKYGASNVQYIGELINDKLDQEDYAGALAYVDQALNVVPADNNDILSQLYNIQGQINDRSEDFTAARASYEKALELNPNMYDAMYHCAMSILSNVDKMTAANDKLSNNDFKDDLLKAANYLETVYNHDEMAYPGAPYSLYSIYYNLGDDYVEKAKYWELLK